jgi:hypothetical protein
MAVPDYLRGLVQKKGRVPLRLRKSINQYLRWTYSLYFKSLKNSFAGQRGFVICNGPSLQISDLDRLTNEVCIASNKVYLAFGKTAWRPRFFTVEDPIVWDKVRRTLHEFTDCVHVPEHFTSEGCQCKIRRFRVLPPRGESQYPKFSTDLSVGAHAAYTVTYLNLQFAAHLGLTPIYVLGCDNYYAGEKEIVPNQAVEVREHRNHFIEGYRAPGEKVNPAPINEMNLAYESAAISCGNGPLKILNATRGGYLEAFPRVEFDSLF